MLISLFNFLVTCTVSEHDYKANNTIPQDETQTFYFARVFVQLLNTDRQSFTNSQFFVRPGFTSEEYSIINDIAAVKTSSKFSSPENTS